MKSVKNWGRSGLGLVFVLALLGVSQGCSKGTDYGLGNVQGDNFSDSDRNAKIKNLKDDYSADIVVAPNVQTYQHEHDVNRVLRYLAANEGSLKDKLSNVVEIYIDDPNDDFTTGLGASRQGSVQWSLAGADGKGNSTFKIVVDCEASAADLDAGFQKFENNYQGSVILTSAGARVGVSILDMMGLTSDQANGFASNLISAASGLDFTTQTAKRYVTVVQIDTIFAMGAPGTVLVKSDASSDDLSSFLSSALNLAKTIDQDLQTVSTTLGVQVSYQPATLVPSEISQGIVSLTAAVNQVRGTTHMKEPIMIGRRTETDASLAKSSGVLLIAFNASPADVANAFGMLDNNSTGAVNQAINDAQAAYAHAGVTFTAQASDFGVSDATTAASLAIVQSAISRLEQAAPPATLAGESVTTVQATSGQTNVQSSFGGTATLQVNLVNLDLGVLSEALANWVNTNALNQMTANRQSEQSSYVSALQSKYPSTSFTIDSYDVTSADKTQAFAAGAQTFERVVTAAQLSQIGITYVKLTKAAASPAEAALVSADKTTLTVDLYLITDSVLKSVLQAAVPPPAPTPAPSPSSASE